MSACKHHALHHTNNLLHFWNCNWAPSIHCFLISITTVMVSLHSNKNHKQYTVSFLCSWPLCPRLTQVITMQRYFLKQRWMFFLLIFWMCMVMLTVCIFLKHNHGWCQKRQEDTELPRTGVNRWLWAAMCVLASKLESYTRAYSAINQSAITPFLAGRCFQRQIWLVEGIQEELVRILTERNRYSGQIWAKDMRY